MFKGGVPEIKRTSARSFKIMQGLENEIILEESVPPATRPVSTKAETQTQARRHTPCKSQKEEVMLGVGVGNPRSVRSLGQCHLGITGTGNTGQLFSRR